MVHKLLIEQVSDISTLRDAWDKINKRKESSGLDNVTIQQFKARKDENLQNISNLLKSRKYKFRSLEGVPKAKTPGDRLDRTNPKLWRPLKVPAVSDRVVQKSIEIAIKPSLEREYQLSKNPINYAYIKDRKLVEAVSQVRDFYHKGQNWYYKGDIEKFFDNVDKDLLLDNFIFPKLPDQSIKTLIKDALSSEIGNKTYLESKGFLVDKIFPNLNTGLPQGGVLSPLFSNVYLSGFDNRMLTEGFNMVRWADDFIVLCETKDEAERAERIAQEEIKKLNLTLHAVGEHGSKSVIAIFNQVTFVGIRFAGNHIYPAPNSFAKFIDEIVRIGRRHKSLIDDLRSVQNKINAWGATYYFTDISTREAGRIYPMLNNTMRATTKNIFSYYGLVADTHKLTKKGLSRLGLADFDESIRLFRKKHPNKPIDYATILQDVHGRVTSSSH